MGGEGFGFFWAQTDQAERDLIRAGVPRFILLDICLPNILELDVCRTLRNEGKPQPILMFAARGEEVKKVLGLKLGAVRTW